MQSAGRFIGRHHGKCLVRLNACGCLVVGGGQGRLAAVENMLRFVQFGMQDARTSPGAYDRLSASERSARGPKHP